MKIKGLIFILLLVTSQLLIAQTPNINGFVRNYSGVLFDDGDFSIQQNTLSLDFSKSGNKVAFKANPMLYHYNEDSLDFRMREVYLDLYFDNFDLRIGKQQIVWGKADGAFITDIVSPLNLTEFLLPDFDEIRRGVNAIKFDYYIGNSIFEIIWMPVFTSTQKPTENSIWYIKPEFPAPVTFDWSKSDIDASLENSEVFMKYSALTSKIDFEIMGGYTWDDNPTMHTEKQFDMSSGSPILTGLNITPKYHRLTIGGGSFSTEIKGVVLRGEAAYYNGKYFQTEDSSAVDAIIEKNYLHYLLGFDFVVGGTTVSTQLIQESILDYDENILTDQIETTMTFLIRDDFMHETLHIELFTYLGLNNEDALIRPKITYDFDDSFSILAGSNIFVGDRDGRFGQYKDNSMGYLKIKYSF
ncbi:MAG: DUF1302 family protein [Bacteroidota bacterium]|nr:DUF1302 family protein [Bacteroidota bacterium]